MSASPIPLPDVSLTIHKVACHRRSTDDQFAKYYREGTYDYCPARFKAWHLCLKISKPSAQPSFNRRHGSARTPAGKTCMHTAAGTTCMHTLECCFRLTRAACRVHQEWARTVPRTHLWAFRPEYEAEAYERYGLRPAEPSAHPAAQHDAVPSEGS